MAAPSPGTGAGQATPFSGVALPAGYSLDSEHSLTLGAGERWSGRLVFTVGLSASEVFDFYRREMPRLGWSEGAVMRADTSVLTFNSAATARVAVVQIADRTLGGVRVQMVVSPETGGADAASVAGQPEPLAAAARAAAAPAGAAPRAPVASQPLQ